MEIVNVQQGTKEWLDLRMEHFTASDAPAMMGVSKYLKRDELLAIKKTGTVPEVSPATQALFNRGHDAEAAIRPHIEEMIGSELYPATGTKIVDGLPLLASFDGITMTGDIDFEHKLYSESLAAQVRSGKLDDHYKWQLDQQLLLSGAEKAIFVTSDGTPGKMEWMWYKTTPERLKSLIAGWKQFEKDLAEYEYVPAVIEPIAAPVASLPAISYQLNGMAIKSNLDEYRDAAERLVEESRLPMTTDQEFATAEVRNKALRKAVKDIKAVCDRVINEVSDIAKFRDDLMSIGEMLRQAALNGEKQVKARKEQLRFEIIKKAERDLADHCYKLDKELDGGPYLGGISGNFINVAKGKSKLSSVQSAVNDELARAKIESDGIARKIRVNLKTLSEEAEEFKFLFADYKQIIFKEAEDFGALVRDRVAQHKAEVARKAAEAKADEERKDAEKKAAEEQAEAKRKAAEERDRAAKEYMELTVAEGEAAGRQKAALKNGNENKGSIEKEPTTQIMESIAAHGIPAVIANRIAQLIVDGKIDRVYFS